MGNEDIKVVQRGAQAPGPLTIERAVRAAMANFRDRFRETVGSEPIVAVHDNMFEIDTYGGGAYITVGRFGLEQLQGCCGVVVLYHASVTPKFLKRGLGGLFLEVRERAAVLAGYSFAQATVVKTNKTELRLLESRGWSVISEFRNRRTGNTVLLLTKAL